MICDDDTMIYVLQSGLTALHLASKEGHVDIVVQLLKLGADNSAASKVSVHKRASFHAVYQT
jgi:ankyrin repeat protein